MSTTADQDGVATEIAEPSVAIPETPASTALALREEPKDGIAVFANASNFGAAKEMARALAASTIVPSAYRNQAPNCMIALEIAGRVRASVIMVMQHLYIVESKPAWSAVFLIGSINTCGQFSKLRFEIRGGENPKDPKYRVRAVARERSTGDLLEGEWITWEIVNDEGWNRRKGSKWLTMPGQMFRYRAASFWAKVYAPEISLGMQTVEEVEDYVAVADDAGAATLNAVIHGKTVSPTETGDPVAVVDQKRPSFAMASEDDELDAIRREEEEEAERQRREEGRR